MLQRAVALPGRSPSGPCRPDRSPGTFTLTATGPPSTPMLCAETPTQMSPLRTISSCRVAHSGSAVDAAADVQPLDDDVAAEGRGLCGTAYQDPGAIGGGGARRERPAAVERQRPAGAVRRRGAGRRVLMLHVPDGSQDGRVGRSHIGAAAAGEGGDRRRGAGGPRRGGGGRRTRGRGWGADAAGGAPLELLEQPVVARRAGKPGARQHSGGTLAVTEIRSCRRDARYR